MTPVEKKLNAKWPIPGDVPIGGQGNSAFFYRWSGYEPAKLKTRSEIGNNPVGHITGPVLKALGEYMVDKTNEEC